MLVLFWFSLIFIGYAYIGYPCTLWLLASCCLRPVCKKRSEKFPSASVVISLKNEENRVQDRLRDIASQKYPGDLEIVLISDNSTDATVSLAKELTEELERAGISLNILEQTSVVGKPAAVNSGVGAARGEIIVFADARQSFAPGALIALIDNFSDPQVGCVSGELVFRKRGECGLHVEMGAYWQYEKKVRKLESITGSVIGATGAIYALRKELYSALPESILLDDVLTPVNILCKRHRVCFEPGAVAYDDVSGSIEGEWQRKVRTLAGNWQLIGSNLLFRAIRYNFFFRFFWHKAARLFVPFFLITSLVSSFCLSGWYLFFGFLQLVFYGVALYAAFRKGGVKNSLLKLCYFFCVLNLAVLVGLWVWATGNSCGVWRKSS